MAKWHLCSPLGTSERTTEADSEFWAKRRFAPIPKGWYVQSDASYRIPMYQVKPELLTVCSKCNRHPAVEGRNQCEACASHKRNAYHKRTGKNAKSDTRSSTLRQRFAQETPEAKEARRERMRKAAAGNVDVRSRDRKMRARDASIRNGIARRRAKRETQLSLFGA
jgi:hypothetical protein